MMIFSELAEELPHWKELISAVALYASSSSSFLTSS